MGEFVKRKHPDIFFSPAIDMELRSDVSLTFLEALIHMIGMFMIHLYGGGDWIHTFWRPVILILSFSVVRGLQARLQRGKVERTSRDLHLIQMSVGAQFEYKCS